MTLRLTQCHQNWLTMMVCPTGFEPATFRVGVFVVRIIVPRIAYAFNYSRDNSIERCGVFGCDNRSAGILFNIFADLSGVAYAAASDLLVFCKAFRLMSFR